MYLRSTTRIQQTMKYFISTTLLFLLLIAGCQKEKHSFTLHNGILIENVTVITANSNGEIVSYKGFVATDSANIVYAGSAKPNLSGTFTTIDGDGKYLIPGLIDSHVHLANMAGMNFRQKRKYPEMVKQYYEQLPKSFLLYGYTTLIDVNNYAPQLIDKLRSADLGPDIFACGEQVQVMDDFMMEMEELPQQARYNYPFLFDNYNEIIQVPDSIDLSSHSAKAIVDNIVEEQNGICVKTLYEDASSGMKETWAKPSTSILKDVVQEAKAQGVPTILHSPSFEGQSVATEAGIDIIAHAMWNWSDNPDKITETTLPQSHQLLLDKIVDMQMGYQPTFRTILGETDLLNKSMLNSEELKQAYPTDYLNWINSEEGQWLVHKIHARPKYLKLTNPEFFNAVRAGFPSDSVMMATIYQVLETRINKVTNYLADHDANLLFGTDFGAMNMYTLPPGYGGFLEMKHWEEAGVDHKQILKAATYNNAEAFHLDHLYGTVEKSKIANLLILDSNPLKTVDAYNDINTIFFHGHVISKMELLPVNKP